MSALYKRNGLKWNTNELLALHREVDLLKWSAEKIAEKHQRTIKAIKKKINDELLDIYVDEWVEYAMAGDPDWDYNKKCQNV
jgi:predicted transcriptional regulator